MQSYVLSHITRALVAPGQASCSLIGCKGLKGALVSSKVMESGVWWLPGAAGTTPIIGGHRGMGENKLPPYAPPGKSTPEYRENTVASLREAAAQGARFVEFDVQVTSDGVPVLWHDDWILTRKLGEEGHASHKISELTLQQFKESQQRGLLKRMRPPGDYKSEGTIVDWTVVHDDGLPTLSEVFESLPPEIGFDIEVKMAIHDQEHTPSEEVDRMVGPILATVLRYTETDEGSARPVGFTSFDPDVCLALRLRAPKALPVLFLTVGLPIQHPDARRNSLEAAFAFAAASELQGVVPLAKTLDGQLHLLQDAAQKGLAVVTWGDVNNQAEFVKVQASWGVGAVILDDVSQVVKALTVR